MNTFNHKYNNRQSDYIALDEGWFEMLEHLEKEALREINKEKLETNNVKDHVIEDDDVTTMISRDDFHAIVFKYHGIHYSFAGWWILDWNPLDWDVYDESKCKIYDSKDEFLADPIFDNRTIAEIESEMTDIDYTLDP